MGASVPVSEPAIARARAVPGRSPGTREIVSLAPGDRVTHDTFGLGTVVSTSGVADKSEATIDFGDLGIKRLLLRYAPVEKL
jgi:DNA helicase-2/ATP-dependent DNA helicase PcrA